METGRPSANRSCRCVRGEREPGQERACEAHTSQLGGSASGTAVRWHCSRASRCGDESMRSLVKVSSLLKIRAASGKLQRAVKPARLVSDNANIGRFAIVVVVGLLLLIAVSSLKAQSDAHRKALGPKPNIASASLASHLANVRADSSNGQPAPGSIWTDSGRLTRMTTDVRAMRPHDLISVVVSES